MDKEKIVEIAARIYGLYLLVKIPIALWGIISVFAMNQDQFVKNPFLYKTWAIINPVLYLIIAIFLIFKADYISKLIVGKSKSIENDSGPGKTYMQMSFWITLLGLYFVIESSASFIRNIIMHPPSWGNRYDWSIIISYGLQLFLSLYMVFRSENVENIILIKSKSRS